MISPFLLLLGDLGKLYLTEYAQQGITQSIAADYCKTLYEVLQDLLVGVVLCMLAIHIVKTECIHFSEVSNVWWFQYISLFLSASQRLSNSPKVCYERFHCIHDSSTIILWRLF